MSNRSPGRMALIASGWLLAGVLLIGGCNIQSSAKQVFRMQGGRVSVRWDDNHLLGSRIMVGGIMVGVVTLLFQAVVSGREMAGKPPGREGP